MSQSALTYRAPGKVILSGEHAVVMGEPALAMAIDAYVDCTIAENTNKNYKIKLMNIDQQFSITRAQLLRVLQRTRQNYQLFTQQQITVKNILQQDYDLVLCVLASILERLQWRNKLGLEMTINSSLPIGCGLGSSAAMIVSMLKAIAEYHSLTLSDSALLEQAIMLENYQHGHSSGIDPYIAVYGSGIHYQQGVFTSRQFNVASIQFVFTGTPASTTGECVAKTTAKFKQSTISKDIAVVTAAIDVALQQQNKRDLQLAIAENHRLLVELGVVPEKVQTFIGKLAERQCVAKISGAGSVSGDNAGIVLVVGDSDIGDILHQFNYQLLPLKGEVNGLQRI